MNQYEVTSNYDVYNTMISVIGDATFHLQHPSITESVYKPISYNYFSDSLTALIRFIIFSYKSPAPASPCTPSCYCVPAAGTNICGSGSESWCCCLNRIVCFGHRSSSHAADPGAEYRPLIQFVHVLDSAELYVFAGQ